jgi:hypothetical protein
MDIMSQSKIIYGSSPFIEDMGLLTTLCLLHDEVILFGTNSLGDQFEKYWANNNDDEAAKVIEQTFQVLAPEGIVTFLSPEEAMEKFPTSDVNLDGIEGVTEVKSGEKTSLSLNIEKEKLSPLSKLILQGINPGQRTVSSLLRDVTLFSAAYTSKLPIVSTSAHISINRSESNVPTVANYLAHKALERLALPQLKAYHAEDILEARVKLRTEFIEFKAAILELVWLLHQKIDLDKNLETLPKECSILIDTKIASALLLFESAISTHKSNSIRRIFRSSGNVILELGKSLVSPDISTALLGGSAAMLKATESMNGSQPSNHIASYVYRLREKAY